jgi:hypothetical protein
MRTISVAWEAYAVDNDRYPVDWDNNPVGGESTQIGLIMVTTPIAYLSSFPVDPFSVMKAPTNPEYAPHFEVASCGYAYNIFSVGPNGYDTFDGNDAWPDGVIDATVGRVGEMFTGQICMRNYDPTNGAVSEGDLHRLGGDWHRNRAAQYGGNWQVWEIDYNAWNLSND